MRYTSHQNPVDSIIRRRSVRQPATDALPVQSHTVSSRSSHFSWFRSLVTFKLALVGMLVLVVIPLSAFEAHVINVTATIERPPCMEFRVRSLDYWKRHTDLWPLPQTLGDMPVATPADVASIFSAPGADPAEKLRKQVLVLKFNISHFGAGAGLIPDDQDHTLWDLEDEADELLMDASLLGKAKMVFFEIRVADVNEAGKVSTCPCGDEQRAKWKDGAEDENGEPEDDGVKPGSVIEEILDQFSDTSTSSIPTVPLIADATSTPDTVPPEEGNNDDDALPDRIKDRDRNPASVIDSLNDRLNGRIATSTSTASPSVTVSPLPSVSPSATPEPTPTPTPEPSPSPSPSPTPEESPEPTPSPSPSATPTSGEVAEPSPTPQESPVPTPSPNPSPSPSPEPPESDE